MINGDFSAYHEWRSRKNARKTASNHAAPLINGFQLNWERASSSSRSDQRVERSCVERVASQGAVRGVVDGVIVDPSPFSKEDGVELTIDDVEIRPRGGWGRPSLLRDGQSQVAYRLTGVCWRRRKSMCCVVSRCVFAQWRSFTVPKERHLAFQAFAPRISGRNAPRPFSRALSLSSTAGP